MIYCIVRIVKKNSLGFFDPSISKCESDQNSKQTNKKLSIEV